jgi:hypothetical protein
MPVTDCRRLFCTPPEPRRDVVVSIIGGKELPAEKKKRFFSGTIVAIFMKNP